MHHRASSMCHVIGLLAMTVLWGCNEDSFTQVLDVDLPEHTPALAVTCEISERDEVLNVFVSHSLGILDTAQFKILEDAEVVIKKENETLYTLVFNPNAGYYQHMFTDPLILESGEYRLEVRAPGFESVYALQAVGTPVPIDELSFDEGGAITADGSRGHRIEVTWTDPGADINYYALEIYTYTEYMGNANYNRRYIESLDPTIEFGFSGEALIDDSSLNGTRYTARLAIDMYNDDFLEPGGRIYAVLRSLTRDGYLYTRSRELQYFAVDNPFAEPVIVHSNIVNGYGIFSMDSQSTKWIEF